LSPYRITKLSARRVTSLLLIMAFSTILFLPHASSQSTTITSYLDSQNFSLKGQYSNSCGTYYYYYYDSFYVGEKIHGSITSSSPISFFIMSSPDWAQSGVTTGDDRCNTSLFSSGLALQGITSHSFDYTVTTSGRYYLLFFNTGTTTASISYTIYSIS